MVGVSIVDADVELGYAILITPRDKPLGELGKVAVYVSSAWFQGDRQRLDREWVRGECHDAPRWRSRRTQG